MHWTGILEDGSEIDLAKIPCASAFGASDCWRCYKLPELKKTFRMALELALNGQTEVLVWSRSWNIFYGLGPQDLDCDWWREREDE